MGPDIDSIIQIIYDAHTRHDADDVSNLPDICRDVYEDLNVEVENQDWWSEDAMVAIALAAYDAGYTDAKLGQGFLNVGL